MFPHLCFQRCDPLHLFLGDLVTWLSSETCSEYMYGPRWERFRITRKDDVPFRPLRTPFSSLVLFFTLAHFEICLAVVACIPRFEAGVGITADFPVHGLRARNLGASHSAKGFSLRVAFALVDCHLNCWRVETTTSFNFKVLSVFHLSHFVPCSCSSIFNLSCHRTQNPRCRE